MLIEGIEYDYVTRTSQNQGILQTTGFVNKENINPAGTWSLGLLQMDFFYREKPWYAGQFVRKITPKIKINKKSVVFFSTLLNKQKERLLSILVRNVDNVFRNTKISLPVKKDREIDFAFMEDFISQLEAYLLVTGLKNYTLTPAEEQALTDFQNGNIKWGEYRFANVFYRSYDFGAGDDTGVYWNSEKELSKEIMLFLTKASEKALEGKFSYGKKLRSSQSLNFKMKLPTINNAPDYPMRETLISAVQKLVIKDVVEYADRKIEATREIIHKK